MESIRVQEFPLRITRIVGHLIVDINKVQIVALPVYFFFDDPVGKSDAVDNVPAGDTRLDGNKGQRNIPEALTGAAHQLLKKDEYFLRMTAVAQVVIPRINDNR